MCPLLQMVATLDADAVHVVSKSTLLPLMPVIPLSTTAVTIYLQKKFGGQSSAHTNIFLWSVRVWNEIERESPRWTGILQVSGKQQLICVLFIIQDEMQLMRRRTSSYSKRSSYEVSSSDSEEESMSPASPVSSNKPKYRKLMKTQWIGPRFLWNRRLGLGKSWTPKVGIVMTL